jgi:type I restriction enzyme S subunit
MSRIHNLITTHCPDGVPFRALGDIGDFTRGRRFTKEDVVDDGLPCIHYGEIYTRYGTWAQSAASHVRRDLKDQLRFARHGDVVFAGVGETVEDVGKAVAWLGTDEVAFHDDCFALRHQQYPKYIAYAMQTSDFHAQKNKHVARAKVKRISAESLAKIRIPVPPLPVQQEIARVLDRFAELEATLEEDLKAEADARRKQYAHYRDLLLSFAPPPLRQADVRWVPMSELLREPLVNGRSVPDGVGYPVLRLTALHGAVVDTKYRKLGAWDDQAGTRYKIEAGDLLVVRGNGSKNLLARACMVEHTEEVAFPDTMIRVRPNLNIISQRFMFHVWESRWTRNILEQVAKVTSGVWKVSQDDLYRVVLPVPSLGEQARIVGVLDKFDALVNDLAVGLAAELHARRHQYQHYRDRLLSFEEEA